MPIIVGLGWNCVLKNELRKMQRKREIKEEWKDSMQSLPFDFIQSFNINQILSILENKFSDIMIKENLRLKESHYIPRKNKNSTVIQHVFVHKKYSMKFMHRFYSLNTEEDRNNIYKHFDTVKESFDKQSERFLEFVSGDEKIHFVRYLGALHSTKQLTRLAHQQETEILTKRLKELYPNLNYEIHVFPGITGLSKFIKQAFV